MNKDLCGDGISSFYSFNLYGQTAAQAEPFDRCERPAAVETTPLQEALHLHEEGLYPHRKLETFTIIYCFPLKFDLLLCPK